MVNFIRLIKRRSNRKLIIREELPYDVMSIGITNTGKSRDVSVNGMEKIKLLWLLINLRSDSQVIIILKSDKSEIINGKVKDIIKCQTIKEHRYDIVDEVMTSFGNIVIVISLDM